MLSVFEKFQVVCYLLLVASQSLLGLPTEAFAGEPQASQRWALLIGISEYAKLPDLQGPRNDIEILAYVLETRHGFKSDHILILRNEAATRDRINQEFEKLIARTKSSDIVYVHYSGHGSQVKDLNGDELDDHKDETLVPYDGRTPDVPDITDDELNGLIHRIHAQRVIVSIDACHSGSATRGVNIRTRSIPPDTRLELYEKTQRFTRGARVISSPHSVVFSSSAPHERALDGPIAGRYHGYFTYAVFRGLWAAQANANPHMIFQSVKQELHNIKNLLHRRTFPAPQLEVSRKLQNEPLFPTQRNKGDTPKGSGQLVHSWERVLVKPISDSIVELEPARYLGGLPTSVWEIIPANRTSAEKTNRRILATVTAMKGMKAIAEISGGKGLSLGGAYATLVQPAKPPSRLSLLLRDFHATLSDQTQKIQEIFERFGNITQVDESHDYVVDVRERDVAINSADGMESLKTLPVSDLSKLPAELNQFLNALSHPTKLRNLKNPNSSIFLKSRLLNVLRNDELNQTQLADPVLHIHRPHEPSDKFNSLQLEVSVNKPSFLTIFDLDSEGGFRVLFPSPLQNPSYYPNGRLPANEKVVLPDSFEASNRAGFVWDIGEPKGLDTLYIFASTNEGLVTKIRQLVEGFSQDLDRPSRGGSSEKCTSYEKLRNLLYAHVSTDNSVKDCWNVQSSSSGSGPSRGDDEEATSFAQGPQGDWNAVSLKFWVEGPR